MLFQGLWFEVNCLTYFNYMRTMGVSAHWGKNLNSVHCHDFLFPSYSSCKSMFLLCQIIARPFAIYFMSDGFWQGGKIQKSVDFLIIHIFWLFFDRNAILWVKKILSSEHVKEKNNNLNVFFPFFFNFSPSRTLRPSNILPIWPYLVLICRQVSVNCSPYC